MTITPKKPKKQLFKGLKPGETTISHTFGPNKNAGKQSQLKRGGNRADSVLRKFD